VVIDLGLLYDAKPFADLARVISLHLVYLANWLGSLSKTYAIIYDHLWIDCGGSLWERF